MKLIQQIFKPIRQFIWALTLAYMMAWHNVYKEEQQFPDDMAIVMETDNEDEDASDK